jgi:hypothetical protein
MPQSSHAASSSRVSSVRTVSRDPTKLRCPSCFDAIQTSIPTNGSRGVERILVKISIQPSAQCLGARKLVHALPMNSSTGPPPSTLALVLLPPTQRKHLRRTKKYLLVFFLPRMDFSLYHDCSKFVSACRTADVSNYSLRSSEN